MLPRFLLKIFDRIMSNGMILESQALETRQAPENVIVKERKNHLLQEWLYRGNQVYIF